MNTCDAYVAASGNVLAATAFRQAGRPYLAWVATDWQGDQQDRVKHFPLARRLLDKYLNGPVIRRLERHLLASGRVLSLSDHTAKALGDIAGPMFQKVILPVPVDTDLFVPNPGSTIPARLGFAGKLNDPRKNIGLLLQAAVQLRRALPQVSVVLMGGQAEPAVMQMIAALGLQDQVSIKPGLSREQMRDYCKRSMSSCCLHTRKACAFRHWKRWPAACRWYRRAAAAPRNSSFRA